MSTTRHRRPALSPTSRRRPAAAARIQVTRDRRRRGRRASVAGAHALAAPTRCASAAGRQPGAGRRPATRPSRPRRRPTARRSTTTPKCRVAADADDPLRLWIGGDSLAGSLGPSLGKHDCGDRRRRTRLRLAGVERAREPRRSSTGRSTRPRRWPDLDPEVVVFIIGANDYTVRHDQAEPDASGQPDVEGRRTAARRADAPDSSIGAGTRPSTGSARRPSRTAQGRRRVQLSQRRRAGRDRARTPR